jgi:hypothetical protein
MGLWRLDVRSNASSYSLIVRLADKTVVGGAPICYQRTSIITGCQKTLSMMHPGDSLIIIQLPNTADLDKKKLVFTFLYILIFPALLLIAGDPTWPEGWIFCIWFLLLCYSTILYLYRRDPALLEERYKQPGAGNQERWDRYVVYGLLVGFLLWIVVMPLDARRLGWSPVFPLPLTTLGVVGLAWSFFLFFRSYTDNMFLSPLVRIQEDRSSRWCRQACTGLSDIRGTVERP